ncbi:hypothetical protein [uncultured Microscilla sp.]|uniref:hypothetical protein n=1 Tax=uncultured Microscilla sp. TaxID=432653 RepID=UPI002615D00F|nr:hypothetical protein [uncultured Microscilla sp.]
MEYKNRHLTTQKKKKDTNAQEGISGNEYLQRLEFYKKRFEDERQKFTSSEESDDTTPTTPVSKKQDKPVTPSPEQKQTPPTDTPPTQRKEPTTPLGKTDKAPTPPPTEEGSKEQLKQLEKEQGLQPVTKGPEDTKGDSKNPKEGTSLKEESPDKTEQEPTQKQEVSKDQTLKVTIEPTDKTNSKDKDIRSTPQDTPSGGGGSKTLPGGKSGGGVSGKKSGGKGGNKAGGGPGQRMTNIPRPEFADSEKRMAVRIDQEKGKPKASMLKATKPVVDKNKKKIAQTQKAEKKKTPAVLKIKQTKDAEVIPQKASNAEKSAEDVKGLSKKEVKKTDQGSIAQAAARFKQALVDSTPKNADQLQDEEFMGKLNKTAEEGVSELFDKVEVKTQEVGNDFKEIDNPGLGEKPRAAKALPDIEKAQNTALMDVEELKAKQKVPDEQLDTIRQSGDEATKILKKEKIGEGEAISYAQFSEAKSEDLRRGIDQYEKVQEESATGADKVRKTEKAKHDAMAKAIKDKEQAKRSHMRANRDEQLKASRGQQGRAKSDFEIKRAEITAKMDEVFDRTRKAVTERLGKLDSEVKTRFSRAKRRAMNTFTKNVETRLDKFHDDRYYKKGQSLGSLLYNIGRSWFEDTSDLPQVLAIFESERKYFIDTIEKEIASIISYVESEVAACKKMIEEANTALENIVKAQGPAFQKIAKEAYQKIRKQLDKLDSEVDKKANELKRYLEAQRKKAIEEVDKKIAEIKERLKGLLNQVAKFLTDAAYKFFKWVLSSSGFSTEQIDQIINQGVEVLTKIVTDPMGFFQNMVDAVGKGFNNFVGNIGKHLKNGFFAWLTGAMGGTGLNLPQKWDLKGIFSVVLQVMGLDWTVLRARIAKEVGEENLARAEEAGGAGLELLQAIKEKGFVEAVWDMLAEKAEEIKTMVINEIQNWLIVSVVKQATIKILSMLNPAGAIVQAILMIYDFAMWLINNWERIVQIIQNIVSSVGKIAMGMLGEAAKFIENTLANFVPLLLDFMARMLRLGNVSARIKKILVKLRKPIDDLMEKIMAFIRKKLRKFSKKKPKKGGKEKEKEKEVNKKDKQIDLSHIKERYENQNNEKHTLRFVREGKKYVLKRFSSNPTLVLGWLVSKITETNNDPNLSQTQKAARIKKIRDAQEVAREIRDFSYPTPNSKSIKKSKGLKIVEGLVNKLMKIIRDHIDSNIVPVPRMIVTPPFTDNKASSLEVRYLARNNHQPGSATNPDNIPVASNILRGLGIRGSWVAFHIINDEFGGRGINSNLIPTPREINNPDYLNNFERPMRALYRNDDPKTGRNILYMTATISYRSEYKGQFVKKIKVVGGNMKVVKDRWKPSTKNKLSWSKTIPLPEAEYIYVNSLPSDANLRKEIFRNFNIDNKLIDLIYELSTKEEIKSISQIIGFVKQHTSSKKSRGYKMLVNRYIKQLTQSGDGKFKFERKDN